MSKQVAAIVDWYGPYRKLEDAITAAKDGGFSEGLYMLIGRLPSEKKTKLQYIGVAKDIAARLYKHKQAEKFKQELKIWLGQIASTGIPGKKEKVLNVQIDLVEWAHAYYLKIPNNKKKTKNPPDKPVTVLNRWWKIDLIKPYWNNRSHPDWADIIDFKGHDIGCLVGWTNQRKREIHGPVA